MSDAKPVQSPLNLALPITKGKNAEVLIYAFLHGKTINEGLKAVGTVHFARFLPTPGFEAIPATAQTLWVLTEFDGTFDDYIQDFVNQMGDIFDKLLSFVDNPPPTPVADNVKAFGAWVQAHDVKSNLYSAYPQSTVDMILNGVVPPPTS